MSTKNEFARELDRLYNRRTHWLRSVIGYRKPGPPPTFRRETVNEGIAKLQDIAYRAFAKKLAKQEFAQFAPSKRSWHVKGYGREEKRKIFNVWFVRRLGNHQNRVYIFWGKRGKCIYIGRTGNGGSRPDDHFEKYWFGRTRRIDIYPVKQASQLPKLECLAIHRFLPAYNKTKAATQKWTKRCPMCRIHKDIQSELRSIFRFR